MNIENALKVIQDFRAGIDQWGVTAETLIAVAAVATLFFLLSLREVLSWYLRLHALRDDVQSLTKEIQELKAALQERPLIIEKEVAVDLPATSMEVKKKDEEEKSVKTFPLAH